MNRLIIALLFAVVGSQSFADPLGCLASRYLGQIEPGPYETVFLGQGRAVYAFGLDGPRVGLFDVSNPTQHVELGSVALSDFAGDIKVRGDLVYVLNYNSGLEIYRLTPEHEFVYLSAIPLGGACWSMELVGEVVFATDESRLHAIDVSDPESPFVLDTIDTGVPFRLYGTAIANGALYAGSDEGVIQILIDDPSNLTLGATVGQASNRLSLLVEDDYLYLAARTLGLQIFDVTDSGNVQLVSQIDTLGDCFDIAKHGDRLFVSEREFGFSVIDVSDVAVPKVIGEYYFENEAFSSTIDSEIEVMYVSLSGDAARAVVDISPALAGSVMGSFDVLNRPWAMTVVGEDVYAAEDLIMRAIDAAEPTQMQQIGFIEAVGPARDIAQIDPQSLVLAVGGQGIQVVDITVPTTPVSASILDVPGFALGVEVSGNVAFVAARQGGLSAVDLHDQSQPSLLGTVDVGGNAIDAFVRDDLCYVAASAGGLAIVDVSDPGMMSVIGSAAGPYSVTSVGVLGSLAVVGTSDTGCVVFDVSDPTNPTPLGEITVAGLVRDVAFNEGVLYLSVENEGVYAYSLTDPSMPRLLGHEPIEGLVGGIGFGSGVAYVGVPGQVYAIDVSSVCGQCPADLTGDGVLDFFDVSVFLVAFSSQDGAADWNGDGDWDFFDVSGFLVDFQTGCP